MKTKKLPVALIQYQTLIDREKAVIDANVYELDNECFYVKKVLAVNGSPDFNKHKLHNFNIRNSDGNCEGIHIDTYNRAIEFYNKWIECGRDIKKISEWYRNIFTKQPEDEGKEKRERLVLRWKNKYGKLLADLRKSGYQCLLQKMNRHFPEVMSGPNVQLAREVNMTCYLWECKMGRNYYLIPSLQNYLGCEV